MGISEQDSISTIDVTTSLPSILVIGNGPVGVHFINRLIKQGWLGQIKVFGEEKFQPYNRVLLSSFLSGEVDYEALSNPIEQHQALIQHLNCRIVKIDCNNRQVKDQFGEWHPYDKLILATGSRPFTPSIEGLPLKGFPP